MSMLDLEVRLEEIFPPYDPPPRLGSSVAEWIAYRATVARGEKVAWRRQLQIALMPSVPSPNKETAVEVEEIPPAPIMLKSIFGKVTIGLILQVCAEEADISVIDICSARRTVKLIIPRQTVMYLAKKMTLLSYPQIGRRIGGRDHTTVLYGVRKIERLIADDSALRERIAKIEYRITGYLPT